MSGWKACDIRGPYPAEVSAPMFEAIGMAMAARLAGRGAAVVAGDLRPTTPELKSALIAGLARGGAVVLDIGLVPTPVAYFAERHLGAAAALVVTASHNPPGHNGLKFSFGQAPLSPEDLAELRSESESGPCARPGGKVAACDPLPAYREWILGRWAGGPRTRVVLDAGNGGWSVEGPRIFEALGFEAHRLFCEPDGTYPNRPPDSARPANLRALGDAVRTVGAAAGIAWDGDGDRVSFADETGSVLGADETAMLLIRALIAPGDRAIYDLKLSDAVRRAIAAAGGEPLIERSGHSFIKSRMLATGARLGCEVSGHYFYGELGGGDDGLFTALLMSRLIAEGGPLSTMRAALPRIFATPDLRLAATIEWTDLKRRFRNIFPEARALALDGLRLETADGFVLARPSVTEPMVTIRIEGFDAARYERLLETCLAAIPEMAGQARAQIRQVEGL